MNFKCRSNFYIDYLKNNVIPLWLSHSLDKEYRGFFTCLDREGKVFDTGKFMCLQHRQVWIFSTLYHNLEQNLEYLEVVKQGRNQQLLEQCVRINRATKEAIDTAHARGKQYKNVLNGLPTFISPWIDGEKAVAASGEALTKEEGVSVEQHEKEWDEILDGIHEVVDAVAFQSGHIDYEELDDFFIVNKKLVDKYSIQCWTNVENFDCDTPITLLLIRLDELLMKLEAAKRAGHDKASTIENCLK